MRSSFDFLTTKLSTWVGELCKTAREALQNSVPCTNALVRKAGAVHSRLRLAVLASVAAVLAACSSGPEVQTAKPGTPVRASSLPRLETHSIGPSLQRPGALWTPVVWTDLPGFSEDDLDAAWPSWVRSCERPIAGWGPVCAQVRELLMASVDEKRVWMQHTLQPYLVRKSDGNAIGMLTSYYEPVLRARRTKGQGYEVPLHKLPVGYNGKQPWFTRKEIETAAGAQTALQGRELAWLENPVDAMVLHIQGSGRLILEEPNGEVIQARVAFAGTNNQPYKSIGRWLLDRRLINDASWPGIKAWVNANPQRVQEMLWSNPRYVFFTEEDLTPQAQNEGPRGAQGVPLTPGRSIAVDRRSIPYGTPVWLVTAGATLNENRLVVAQDTGSAILGAVRADYFAGWGDEAGDLAGRVKQDLYLWTLWPKGVAVP